MQQSLCHYNKLKSSISVEFTTSRLVSDVLIKDRSASSHCHGVLHTLGRAPHQVGTEEGARLTALDTAWSVGSCLQVHTVPRAEPEAPCMGGGEGVAREVECHWVA